MSELYLIYSFIVETKNVTEHQLRLFLVNVFFQSLDLSSAKTVLLSLSSQCQQTCVLK